MGGCAALLFPSAVITANPPMTWNGPDALATNQPLMYVWMTGALFACRPLCGMSLMTRIYH